MTRLIISFYLMLFVSLAIFFIGFMGTLSVALPEPFVAGTNQKMIKSTLILLNEEFHLKDEHQTKTLLEHYRKLFGKDLSLLDPSSLSHLSQEQQASLKAGELAFEVIENPIFINKQDYPSSDKEDTYWFYYFKQTDSRNVWRINFDVDGGISFPLETNEDEAPSLFYSKFLSGMMAAIRSSLLKDGLENWQTNIKHIQLNSGLDVNVVDEKLINMKAFQDYKKSPLSSKTEEHTFRYIEDNGDISIVQRIPNSTLVLKVGPFEVSWFTQHIDYLLMFAVLLGFLSTFILFLWPLWSNLLKIKHATDKFGKGNYSARIPSSKLSPIKSISNAFNTMAKQTQDSIRSQKELTSAVSHELRTPIARMKFALETLEYSQDEKEKNASIIDIKEDIAELNSLVDELLLYARYDQKNATLNLADENLANWFNNSLERLQPLAVNKTLHYQLEGLNSDETNQIDARLMTRVVDNLVQNALRYAKSEVSVRLRKNHNGYLLLVEDDGEGIPEDQHNKIFEAFSRIDNSRNRKTGGYGLGLAIVEKIITAHKGRIHIQTSTLGGALFEVYFPTFRDQ